MTTACLTATSYVKLQQHLSFHCHTSVCRQGCVYHEVSQKAGTSCHQINLCQTRGPSQGWAIPGGMHFLIFDYSPFFIYDFMSSALVFSYFWFKCNFSFFHKWINVKCACATTNKSSICYIEYHNKDIKI